MSKQLQTMKVSGGNYAKVAARLLEFRQDNPRASIKTSHTVNPDGSTTFSTYILMDKANEYSADATGSASYSADEMKNPKAFEKLETISVGRALSLLGYLNNGEVATTEEMEEFNDFKFGKKIEEARTILEQVKDLSELQRVFMSLEPSVARELVPLKDELKAKLGAST